MELPVVKNFLTVLQKLLPARNRRQLTLTGGPLCVMGENSCTMRLTSK